MDVTPTISLLELVWTLQAIAGLAIMAYTAYDNRLSLKALRSLVVNGFGELTASIGFWDGVAGIAFHFMFLVIGVTAMTVSPAPHAREIPSQIFGWSFVLGQSFVLGIQIRNQLARLRMRGDRLGGFMTPQLSAALQRAFFIAGGAFLLAALGTELKTHDLAAALLAGLGAVVAVLGGRGILEGLYDGNRAAKGNVLRSDVQHLPDATRPIP